MKHYTFVVDFYRRPSRKHNTAGLYVVYAKNEKIARKLLQSAIKFGSIQPFGKYENHPDWTNPFPKNKGLLEIKKMKRNECFKITDQVKDGYIVSSLSPAVSDTVCQK